MATKKTAVSEEATRASKTSQPARKAPARAKKQAAAPKAVRAKKPSSAPKVVRAKKPIAADTTDENPASISAVMNADERRHLIAEAAYLRAESRGFAAGGEAEDWLLAEQEIDRRLRAG